MRAEYFLLFIAAVFVGESDLLKKILKEFFQNPLSKKNLPLLLAGLIVVLSLINKVLNGHLILCKTDYYAAFYLFPFLILSSILVNDKRFFNFLLIFTTIECLFGILEYLTGVRSIFLGSNSSNQIVDYSLLYNSRVYGLSANSSIFAYKILLAFILVDFSKIKGPFLWTLRILLLIGLMISFSRTVVIVLLFYWFIQLLVFLYRKRRTVFNYDPFRFSFLIVVIALVLFVPLRYQLSRGDKQAESVYKPLTVENRKAITCSEIHALTIKQGEKDPEKMGWGDKMMKASENIESSGRKLT
jgi:hypothetical protein